LKKKFFLVTGLDHSGTRVPIRLLLKHNNVFRPNCLNYVLEFDELHKFFEKSLDEKSFHNNDYKFDEKELFNILDKYFDNNTCEIGVIKFPVYPLFCLDLFNKYFDNNLKVIITKRSFDNFYKSFTNRDQHLSLFGNNSVEFIRQLKKLDINERSNFIDNYAQNKDIEEFFKVYYNRIVRLSESIKTKYDSFEIDFEDNENLINQFNKLFTFCGVEKNDEIDLEKSLNIKRLQHKDSYSMRKSLKIKYPKVYKFYKFINIFRTKT
jgi:hypothetical protein